MEIKSAQYGDIIRIIGTNEVGVVFSRYYEAGEVDNGVIYLDESKNEFCAFDGTYEIIGTILK